MRSSVSRSIPTAAIFLLALAFCAVTVIPSTLSGFAAYDDEGSYLLGAGLAAHGHSVYTAMYSEYGPGFWTLIGVPFHVLPANHDAGRLLTCAAWLLIILLSGIVVHRVTGSRAAALFGMGLSFGGLQSLAVEPLQPECLIAPALLLSVIPSLSPRMSPARRWGVTGVLLAVVGLSKINIGVLAVLAAVVTMVMLSTLPLLVRSLAAAAFVCAPLLLTVQLAGTAAAPDFLAYAGAVSIAALLLMLCAAEARQNKNLLRAPRVLGAFVAGGVGGTAALILLALPRENLADILTAIVIHPLGQAAGLVRVPEHTAALFVAACGIALAAGLHRLAVNGSERRSRSVLSWMRVVVGVALAGQFLPSVSGLWFASLPMFGIAGMFLLVMPRSAAESPKTEGRFLLGALTVSTAMQAYPTAASQLQFAGWLTTLSAVIILSDGLSDLLATERARSQAALRFTALASAGLIALSPTPLLHPVKTWSAYEEATPLGLPGSGLIHTPKYLAAGLQQTVADIRTSGCVALLALPQMHSFYIWSGLMPPRGVPTPDGGLWLDPKYQAEVAPIVGSAHGLCVIRNDNVQQVFRGTLPVAGPLVDVISEKYRDAADAPGGYRLLLHS